MRKLLFVYVVTLGVTLGAAGPCPAALVHYELDIDYLDVNITGRPARAMAIDGRIPAPAIRAALNDRLRVTFHNRMDVDTSIHWHGVLLPNDQDGVPYLTTAPIAAGGSLTYEYPITHTGTYWYHAHTGLQEQRGIYGALIFQDPQERQQYDAERILVLSDWTDTNPDRVLANLKREADYYSLQKDTVQSWLGVLQNGVPALRNRMFGAWIRMEPMDISDVAYDAFLINGRQSQQDGQIGNGRKVRLRIINAGASSYFFVEFSGGKMTIVEADGVAVQEKTVQRLRVAIAETYDAIVEIPAEGRYELRATAEDGSGHASYYFGAGETVPAPTVPRPNLYLIGHGQHGHGAMSHGGHHGQEHGQGHEQGHGQGHKQGHGQGHGKEHGQGHGQGHGQEHGQGHGQGQGQSEYAWLAARSPTAFDPQRKRRDIALRLTGAMERYNWSFDNRALTEADKIRIRRGEIVRFHLINETMMHHPIHLHGHFFRVLNGAGEHAPLKHTVNVPPLDTVIIEFAADEEKDWFFHCHNLYHMTSGMARVVSYIPAGQDDHENSDFYRHQKQHGNPWYFFADLGLETHMILGELWTLNRRNGLELEYDYNYAGDYDIDGLYHRQVTRFFAPFLGFTLENEGQDSSRELIAGVHYTLPLAIDSDWRAYSDGHLRLRLKSTLQLTDRLKFTWRWNTDDEYRGQLSYEINKKFALTSTWDSDFHGGAGVQLRF